MCGSFGRNGCVHGCEYGSTLGVTTIARAARGPRALSGCAMSEGGVAYTTCATVPRCTESAVHRGKVHGVGTGQCTALRVALYTTLRGLGGARGTCIGLGSILGSRSVAASACLTSPFSLSRLRSCATHGARDEQCTEERCTVWGDRAQCVAPCSAPWPSGAPPPGPASPRPPTLWMILGGGAGPRSPQSVARTVGRPRVAGRARRGGS